MSIACSDRIDKESEEGSRFSGYDRPRSTRGRNTEGNGGDKARFPPRGGNVPGGGDLGDSYPSSDRDNSDSPPFNQRKILESREEYWDHARKVKYDKRLRRLLKLLKRHWKDKGSAHKPEKPERLGVGRFDGDPKDTQRFIKHLEIRLNYVRESLVDDMVKISLVILLLHTGDKKWYNSIHVYINASAKEIPCVLSLPAHPVRRTFQALIT